MDCRDIIRGLTSMSSATYVERAQKWARILEDREAERQGRWIKDVRPDVARKAGVSSGTLENLRNGRLKAVAVHVYERLRAALDRELVAEMRALEHELQLLRQQGADPRDIEVDAVVAHLAAVRKALGVAPRRGVTP